MEKKLVSFENLKQYHEKLVGKMNDDHSALLKSANEYTDSAVTDALDSFKVCENDDIESLFT